MSKVILKITIILMINCAYLESDRKTFVICLDNAAASIIISFIEEKM
jgi:hypothetical protein